MPTCTEEDLCMNAEKDEVGPHSYNSELSMFDHPGTDSIQMLLALLMPDAYAVEDDADEDATSSGL